MSKIEIASPFATPPDECLPAPRPCFPCRKISQGFSDLAQNINGHPLVYLDNAASAQKPRMVIEAMHAFMETDYANIHRGVHELSVRATDKYEAVRGTVRHLSMPSMTRKSFSPATAPNAINLVAASWGRKFLKAGDEIVITTLEHHANIVPWQMLRDQIGIKLTRRADHAEGEVRIEDVKAALSPRTKLVAVAHVSNALGTIFPVAEISSLRMRRSLGADRWLPGCRHMPVDVQRAGCRFLRFFRP